MAHTYKPRRKKSMSNDWNLQIFQHTLEERVTKKHSANSGLSLHSVTRRTSSTPKGPRAIAIMSESSDIIYVQVPAIKKEVTVILQEVEQVRVRKVIKAVKQQITKFETNENSNKKYKFCLHLGDRPLNSEELIVSHLRTTKHFTLMRKPTSRPFLEQIKKTNSDTLDSSLDIPKILYRSCENLSNKIAGPNTSPRNSKKFKKEQIDTLLQKINDMESTIRTLRKKDFGDVEFIKDLGKGISGQVKSCYVNGWICALKEISFDDSNKLDILSEIELYSRLPAHDNLVRYLGHNLMGEDRKIQLFIKQYNGNLRDQIVARNAHNSQFEPMDINNILIQITKGLMFLHNNNVIHRDLKSENIFVKTNKSNQITNCAIGDLGTAKYITNSHKAKTVIGTAAFIAPEVLNSDNVHAYTTQADVYSFGMIIFELLALRLPYEEFSKSWQITGAVLEGTPPTLPELDSKYNSFIELFNQCTQFIPQKRPTPEAILKELESQVYQVACKKSNSF